jgi:hypothetical protein
MNKLLICILSLLTVSALTPSKNAEAGIVILGALNKPFPISNVLYPLTIGAGLTIWGGANDDGTLQGLGGFFLLIGLVLDVDGSLPQDVLVEGLAKSFPFIDNREVLHDFANATREKYLAQPKAEEVTVRFNEQEVREKLSKTSATEAEIMQVVEHLK